MGINLECVWWELQYTCKRRNNSSCVFVCVCVYMCVCESWAHCSSLVIFFIFHYSTKGSKFRLWRGSFKRGSIGAESHYLNHQKSKKR